jgi:hypothetical protein
MRLIDLEDDRGPQRQPVGPGVEAGPENDDLRRAVGDLLEHDGIHVPGTSQLEPDPTRHDPLDEPRHPPPHHRHLHQRRHLEPPGDQPRGDDIGPANPRVPDQRPGSPKRRDRLGRGSDQQLRQPRTQSHATYLPHHDAQVYAPPQQCHGTPPPLRRAPDFASRALTHRESRVQAPRVARSDIPKCHLVHMAERGWAHPLTCGMCTKCHFMLSERVTRYV